MGRVIVSIAMSVDGYLVGSGGDLSVMPLDESFSIHNAELIGAAGTLLYGGTTYRQMLDYWPGVLDDPDASEADQRIAQRMADGIQIVAISDSLAESDTGPWREQTKLVGRDAAVAAVSALREGEGDIVIFGSRTVWTNLMAEGLVDELYLMIGPRIVAGDMTAFAGVPMTDLTLLDVTQHPGSPAVVLHYRVEKA